MSEGKGDVQGNRYAVVETSTGQYLIYPDRSSAEDARAYNAKHSKEGRGFRVITIPESADDVSSYVQSQLADSSDTPHEAEREEAAEEIAEAAAEVAEEAAEETVENVAELEEVIGAVEGAIPENTSPEVKLAILETLEGLRSHGEAAAEVAVEAAEIAEAAEEIVEEPAAESSADEAAEAAVVTATAAEVAEVAEEASTDPTPEVVEAPAEEIVEEAPRSGHWMYRRPFARRRAGV